MNHMTLTRIYGAGFVGALALVGTLSHSNPNIDANLHNAINGSLQAAYEDDFKSANPLRSSAVALWGAVKYGVFGQAFDGAVLGSDGWMFTTEELETSQQFNANIQASANRVAKAERQLNALGIDLIVIVVPDKADLYAESLGVQRPQSIPQRAADFSSALAGHNIDVVDAQSALNDAKPQGDVFVKDDTHWSPLGACAVANATADSLRSRSFTQAKVETASLGTEPFDGDLLSYVPTGSLRALFGPAQNTIERFETTVASNGDLFADPTLDIVLVGTSFSAKPEWHFEGFLKQALQADILNFATEGKGPFAPMDAFLASDTAHNSPPQIVVWEIPARYTSKDL